MPTSDAVSRMCVETYLCDCDKKARLFTSQTKRNPYRRFLGCGQPQGMRCNFNWFDVEAEGRNGDVITRLNNQRYSLKEKLVVMEEKIGILEAKLAAKKHQKKKYFFLLGMCYVVIVVLVVIVIQSEKK